MSALPRRARWLVLVLAGIAAVVILTWLLEHAIPPPFSGYLAVVLVGLAAIQLYKRRPRQQAFALFHAYLKARARGADEAAARARLLARAGGSEAGAGTAWEGPSEKARVVGAVGRLLGARGQVLDEDALGREYDRARDRFMIPGWEALPPEFVEAVLGRLDEDERRRLDALIDRYRLFQQRFFQNASSLAADPAASRRDFARLLASLGNRIRKEAPGDAERAYRLSLRLSPDRNLAHAGLALLLDQTGRARDARQEARIALEVLDDYARQAAQEPPSMEDIYPFRTPPALREALGRVAAGD